MTDFAQEPGPARVVGLVLAAGAGRRMGGPKALVDDWLPRSVAVLREGGCAEVTVVLGASAQEAAALIPGVPVVVAQDWAEGMGASLRAGLQELSDRLDGPGRLDGLGAHAVLVSLVDLPDVGPDVVRRLLDRPLERATLARATYDGRPGHPVLIGADHVAGIIASATGDRGARDYLAAHPHDEVECGDLATGVDVDRPPR